MHLDCLLSQPLCHLPLPPKVVETGANGCDFDKSKLTGQEPPAAPPRDGQCIPRSAGSRRDREGCCRIGGTKERSSLEQEWSEHWSSRKKDYQSVRQEQVHGG